MTQDETKVAFEKWAKDYGINLAKNWQGDDYDNPHTTFAWWGFLAAVKMLTKEKSNG